MPIIDLNRPAVDVTDLVKTYRGGKRAVAGISFTIGRGEIFGLLGPNGSGKTTFIRAVVGLLKLDGGDLQVLEQEPRRAERFCAEGWVNIIGGCCGNSFAHVAAMHDALAHHHAGARPDEAQVVAELGPLRRPRLGCEQEGRRVGVAAGARHVHVAGTQPIP